MALIEEISSKPQLAPRLTIAYPQLFVTDVERAASFYADRLGFTISYLYGDPPFYGSVARDGIGFNLRHVDAPLVDPVLREKEVLLSAYVMVEQVEALFREFESAGAGFAQRLKQQAWGMDEFVLRDLDGNLIAFASPSR
jgi:catechol 2,3-dioxygenase-like lactoylglutathione lyase family enzyme